MNSGESPACSREENAPGKEAARVLRVAIYWTCIGPRGVFWRRFLDVTSASTTTHTISS